jgi:hypothetical protein
MNLREFCRIDGYDTAILTTYEFDPLFFERVVLADLLASGVRSVTVIADGPQSSPAITDALGQLVDLGRRYRLIQAWTAGAFHPKLTVKLSSEGAIVACGSANLTCSGWLGRRSPSADTGNREAFGAWRVPAGTPEAADLRAALGGIAEAIDAPARDAFSEIVSRPWLIATSEPPAGRLLVANGRISLADAVAERWRGRRYRRMWMVTGSTDVGGEMLKWAHRTFGIEHAVVEVSPSSAAFDPARLTELPLAVRIRPCPPRPRTHQKIVVFEGDGGYSAIYGSANCSAAGWLVSPHNGGNYEAVSILDEVEAGDLRDLIQLDDSATEPPAAVTFAPPPDKPREYAAGGPRLVRARFVKSSRQLRCAFDRSIDDGASVYLTIEANELQAAPGHNDEWVADLESLRHPGRTHVVLARIVAETETRSRCCLENHDLLESMRRRPINADSLDRLRSSAGLADPNGTLREISKFSGWLLGDWDESDEQAMQPRQRAPKRSRDSAQPVTPEEIFQSLDKHALEQSHPLGRMGAGDLSFAGIMRIVFGGALGDEDEVPDDLVDRELSDRGKNDPSPTSDDEDDGDDNSEDARPERETVPSSARSTLLRHVERFVDAIAAPAFAERCTALQLQQAVAFPLATALIASQGGWIETADERDAWHAVIRRVCELFLLASASGGESVTLIERVGARYTSEGRFERFEETIGDGTLWVLLLAVAAKLVNDADPFERDLLLVEILEAEVLRSQQSAEQLADLCAVARVDDRTQEWMHTAQQARERIKSLRHRLEPLGESLPASPNGAARVGDWLWNPPVGFARIESLDGRDIGSVHIRRRAATRPNVKLRFYVNLRLSGLMAGAGY